METQGILQACFDNVNNALRVTSAADIIYFPAHSLSTIAGTATEVVTNSYPRLSLPDAATTTIGTAFVVPPTWSTMNLGFYWTQEAAGAGNVRWELAVKKTDTFIDNINEAFASDQLVTLAAPGTQGVVTATTAADPVTNFSAIGGAFGNCFAMTLSRIGADAADTYVGAVAVMGLYARRV